MVWLVNLLLDFLVLAGLVRRIRDDRRRGIKIDWFRTLVICLYIAFVTGIGIAVLILLLEFDRPGTGVLLFCAVMAIGAVGLYIGVNRLWPETNATGVGKDV